MNATVLYFLGLTVVQGLALVVVLVLVERGAEEWLSAIVGASAAVAMVVWTGYRIRAESRWPRL